MGRGGEERRRARRGSPIDRCHVSNGVRTTGPAEQDGGHCLSGRCGDAWRRGGGALRDARQPGVPGGPGRMEDQARGRVRLHGFLHARETPRGLRARGGGQPAPGARHLSGLRWHHARARRTSRVGRQRRGGRVGGAHAPLRSVGAARQHCRGAGYRTRAGAGGRGRGAGEPSWCRRYQPCRRRREDRAAGDIPGGVACRA